MISVESTPGKGSVFTIDLPIDGNAYNLDEMEQPSSDPRKKSSRLNLQRTRPSPDCSSSLQLTRGKPSYSSLRTMQI